MAPSNSNEQKLFLRWSSYGEIFFEDVWASPPWTSMGVSIFASGPSSENISIVIVKGLNKNIEKKTLKIVSCALNNNLW